MWVSVRAFAKDFFTHNGFSLTVSKRGVLCFRYPPRISPDAFLIDFEKYAKKLFPSSQFSVDVDPVKRAVCVFFLS